jgi:hypothetical protein
MQQTIYTYNHIVTWTICFFVNSSHQMTNQNLVAKLKILKQNKLWF